MFYRVRQNATKSWFNFQCRGILDTAPIIADKQRVTVVSMVSHRDLTMYLVAIKSFLGFLGNAQIVVLNDGTLTAADIGIINRHIVPVEIISIQQVKLGRCPKGGCWERLLFISEIVEQTYVIQIDSDTITSDEISEVISCVQHNRSFVLGTGMGRNIVSVEEISERMKLLDSNYVQVVAEKCLGNLRSEEPLRYVRGCAGFSGFAKASFNRLRVEEFSQSMELLVAKKWFDWGSEQVASNFFIANSTGACVLPQPKYVNFSPEIPYEESSFLHFIGPTRFKSGVYSKQARRIVQKLLHCELSN